MKSTEIKNSNMKKLYSEMVMTLGSRETFLVTTSEILINSTCEYICSGNNVPGY